MSKKSLENKSEKKLIKSKYNGSLAGLIGNSIASGAITGFVGGMGLDPSMFENYLFSPMGFGLASFGFVMGALIHYSGNQTNYYNDGIASEEYSGGPFGLLGGGGRMRVYDTNLFLKKREPVLKELRNCDFYKKIDK